MPEKLADKTVFSLAEVARSIQKTIAERYRSAYWIKAEMNKLNHYSHSGHCYPELVEKKDGKIVAEMRAILWGGDYRRIDQRFLELTKEPLKNGINILFQATVSYDPLYGFSLRILEIDPTFALGELEREKRESIDRLKQEGLFLANKQRHFPVVPKRLAIISVETSKGYADFLKIIERNPWGYRFAYTLFPALLQGDRSIPSITNQLARIATQLDKYDVVAIIRGGGGDVGLSSYNNFALASAIARFPIPVLTGIGHSTNETVSEMVAFQNAITPSELADFLIQRFHDFAIPVAQAHDSVVRKATDLLTAQRKAFAELVRYFRLNSTHLLDRQQQAVRHHTIHLGMAAIGRMRQAHRDLAHPHQALSIASSATVKGNRAQLANAEQAVRLLDPQQVLRRGYSITRINGYAIKDAALVKNGDVLETRLASGSIASTVTELKPSHTHE